MATHQELAALPAEAFLDAHNFRTGFDAMPSNLARVAEREADGLKVGNESIEVGISGSGTWFAHGKNGGQTTSYERIGYHANTAAFWRGVLASGCRVVVYRNGQKITIREGA